MFFGNRFCLKWSMCQSIWKTEIILPNCLQLVNQSVAEHGQAEEEVATHSLARHPLFSQTGKGEVQDGGNGAHGDNQESKTSICIETGRDVKGHKKGSSPVKGRLRTGKWDRVTEDTEKPEVLEATSALASLSRSLLMFLWLSLGSEVLPTVEENQVRECELVLGRGPVLGLRRQLPMGSCKNSLIEGIKN